MWNKRDFATLAAAAVATFGITLAALWTRTADAVDAGKVATTDVKVPTLKVKGMEITAELDTSKAHTVLLHVKNTGSKADTAEFKAGAQVYGPSSMFSRGAPPATSVWSDDFSLNVPAGETKTIKVTLPAAAYEVAAADKKSKMQMSAGRSQLTLSSGGSKQSIVALPLAQG